MVSSGTLNLAQPTNVYCYCCHDEPFRIRDECFGSRTGFL